MFQCAGPIIITTQRALAKCETHLPICSTICFRASATEMKSAGFMRYVECLPKTYNEGDRVAMPFGYFMQRHQSY